MKNTDRRAYIMNECNSPYIMQAIFILKDGISAEERGVIADAERIVASYMKNSPAKQLPPQAKLRRKRPWLAYTVCTAAILCVLICVKLFL